MTKVSGFAMIVLGGTWWAMAAGAASPTARPAMQPPTHPGKELTFDLGNKVTMKLVLIPAGKFVMGSPKDEKNRSDNEGPQREVTISKPYYMGVYQVTQEQYQQVTGKNPSEFIGARNPVEQVSWDTAVDFCKELSKKTGRTVTLPTEAQWEYACRAGTTTPFNTGETISTDQANYDGNYAYGKGRKGNFRQKPIAVGSFNANAFGLYDMHGNVGEWCADLYADSYANSDKIDPIGPSSGRARVLRNGSALYPPWFCRSACRSYELPFNRRRDVGFRVVVNLQGTDAAQSPPPVAPPPPPPPAASPQVRKELTLDLGNKVTMKLVLIPAGRFMMGSPKEEMGRVDNEGPQHEVRISKPFYMGVYEVTQEQWAQVMGANPDNFKQPQNPPDQMSWDGALDFCGKLSAKTGKTVRLPTEAEWEYACRAGSKTRFCFGDDDAQLSDYAWYVKNSDGKTHVVGQKKPNAWGLYDMYGNVWEWCADWYADSYANAKNEDPTGPVSGSSRVMRGGCWNIEPRPCFRSALRSSSRPDFWGLYFGFRVVVNLQGADAAPPPPPSAAPLPPPAAAPLPPPSPASPQVQKELTLDLGNKVTMKLVLIPSGKFMMGSPIGEKGRAGREGPQREVTITKPFYMGATEVTQEQYELIMGKNPSHFVKPQNPVEQVNWNDAADFCSKLSTKIGKTVCLPTEAQWEYACRAGTKTRFSFGDNDADLRDYGWYSTNGESKTHPVGQKKPNAWGLYDMHGNVWEWCSDYLAESYENAKNVDPKGPDNPSEFRVLRGGCWQYGDCRSADRGGITPDRRYFGYGFRVSVDMK